MAIKSSKRRTSAGKNKLVKYLFLVIIIQLGIFCVVNFSIHSKFDQSDTETTPSHHLEKQLDRGSGKSVAHRRRRAKRKKHKLVRPPRFPIEPLLQPGCKLSSEFSICTTAPKTSLGGSLGPAIAKKLLEYWFHCSAEDLEVTRNRPDDENKPCLWIEQFDEDLLQPEDHVWTNLNSLRKQSQVGVHWHDAPVHPFLMTTELFQSHFWLPTPAPQKGMRCAIDGSSAERSTDFMTSHLTSHLPWEKFLEFLRECDEVVSETLAPIILADSLGAPGRFLGGSAESKLYFNQGRNATTLKLSRADIQRLVQINRRSFPYDLFTPSINYTSVEGNDLKTLVIIMGNLRGGETAWKSLYKNVLDINNADLALVIGEMPPEKKTSSLFKKAKYTYEFPEWNDWGDAIDLIAGKAWRPYILSQAVDEWGTWGGAGGKPGSGAIIFMVRWYVAKFLVEENLLEKYDRFMVTRSDHYYGCEHDLSQLHNDFIWVPQGEDYKEGITDRHVIANRAAILKVLDIYPSIVKHPYKYASDDFADLNPEQLIKTRWKQEGIWPWVHRFDRIMFTCAAEGDTTRWSEHANQTVKEGVFTKYPFEYEETNCVCQNVCDFYWSRKRMRMGYPMRGKNKPLHM